MFTYFPQYISKSLFPKNIKITLNNTTKYSKKKFITPNITYINLLIKSIHHIYKYITIKNKTLY